MGRQKKSYQQFLSDFDSAVETYLTEKSLSNSVSVDEFLSAVQEMKNKRIDFEKQLRRLFENIPKNKCKFTLHWYSQN